MGWTILWWGLGLWAAALAVFTFALWRGHQRRMSGIDPAARDASARIPPR